MLRFVALRKLAKDKRQRMEANRGSTQNRLHAILHCHVSDPRRQAARSRHIQTLREILGERGMGEGNHQTLAE